VQAASMSAARIQWLRDHGYRAVRSHADGDAPQPLLDPIAAIRPSIVFSGESPVSVAIPQLDPGREYYEADL